MTVAALVTFCASFALGAVTSVTASAGDDIATGSVALVPAGKTVDRDYFAAAERVEIAGTINGDAHIVARQVIVSGTINGDLLAAGAEVDLGGAIAHNVRVFAGRLHVTGDIGRNLTATAATLDIDPQARIAGALVAGGASVHVAGPIAKNVSVAGRDVTLAGPVGGAVNAASRHLTLDAPAQIAGNLSYLGGPPPTIHPQAKVGGAVSERRFTTLQLPWSDRFEDMFPWIAWGLLAISALSTLLAGVGILALFPQALERSRMELAASPAAAAGIGFLACLAAPWVLLFLLATLIGIPLALVLGALMLVLGYLGRIVAMVWVGRLILKADESAPRPYAALLVGLLLYYVLRAMPYVGGLVAVAATLLGLGAVLRAALRRSTDSSMPSSPPSSRLMAQEF